MFFKKDAENISVTTINDYTVATKNSGRKTSTESVGKNSFLNYICKIKYKNALVQKVKLTEFFYHGKAYYTIPGLKNTNVLGKNCTSMVPQGICRMDEYILISAYDYDKKCNSVIYVLLADSTYLCATLVYPSKSHVGGMAYDGSYLYVCNSTQKTVSVFEKAYLLDAVRASTQNNLNSVALLKYRDLAVKTTASYCTYFDGRLWAGVFNAKGTDDIFGYSINKCADGSYPSLTADRYIQAPRFTQGIAFAEGKGDYLVVSCSWGKGDSSLRCYKLQDYRKEKSVYSEGIWQIKKGDAYKIIAMPNRAEQVSICKNKMYLAFESGAKAYSSIFCAETDCYFVLNVDKVFYETE